MTSQATSERGAVPLFGGYSSTQTSPACSMAAKSVQDVQPL